MKIIIETKDGEFFVDENVNTDLPAVAKKDLEKAIKKGWVKATWSTTTEEMSVTSKKLLLLKKIGLEMFVKEVVANQKLGGQKYFFNRVEA